MTRRCRHEGCYPDTTCALGHLDRSECEYRVEEQGATSEHEPTADGGDIPWNGYALGTNDLAILAGRGRPIVVGLVGAPDSGKTSLLAFLYMWLLEHGNIPGWTFSGSWTIGAWESLVQHSRWTGDPPPTFPPHTSSSGRVPGLLHLSMRNQGGLLREILFTDAPGEWFIGWARTPGDESAAGARWVIKNSDVLLLLADSGAFSNRATLPQARRDTRDLTERVGALASHLPLGFTWTKTDLCLPSDTRKVLENARVQFAPESEVWETTTRPETIVNVFSRAVFLGEIQKSSALCEPRTNHEPFLAFRGHYVRG